MNTNDSRPPGILGVATAGIQDVSALLPLLGTEQCEKLVTSALQRGFLYAAAAPMSIFGSIGIVKAGFVVLWASIDSQRFTGPISLRNAGFVAPGIGELLGPATGEKGGLYIAEEKLRFIFSKKYIRSVKIDVFSRDLVLWNIQLIAATILLSSFGLLPYIFLITQSLSTRSFRATWLFPIIRIVGCDLVAITIQLILQLRILDETYCRIRFMATDNYFKDHGKQIPSFWTPNDRSKVVLRRLQAHCNGSQGSDQQPRPVIPGKATVHLDEDVKKRVTKGLGYLTDFSLPVFGGGLTITPPSTPTMPLDPNTAEKAEVPEDERSSPSQLFTPSSLLSACQVSLLFGLCLTIAGYVGCFSVVQASPRTELTGPLLWLVSEALLAVFRTVLWAFNPEWDDPPPPIMLEKVARVLEGGENTPKTSSYGIGWVLKAVTADDIHALIIGIDDVGSKHFKTLSGCAHDAYDVATYLADTLLVPSDQIITLYNKEATKVRIIEALDFLSRNPSVARDAPVVIYFATHSSVQNERTYLIPHVGHSIVNPAGMSREELEEAYISYDTIVEKLRHIAEEKTDNIVCDSLDCNLCTVILILDFCYLDTYRRLLSCR
jgi:hypothetical protein